MATRRNYTTIGYQGENRWDTITISIADLVKKYPGGYAYLYVVRAGDDEGYIPRNVEQTENALLWTPDDYDTEYDGILKAQAMYVVNGDVVGKTQIFLFNIDQSLTSFATRPATYEDWVNGLLQAATNVNSEIDAAEATLDGAVEAAQAAQAAAEAAQTAAERAQHTAENAKTSAAQSSNAAYNYAADANRAKRDSVNAKNDAVQAKGDAELAKTAAETAENNANTSALKSEGYAVGTQDGVPAGEGEPYFHDNAKYYKELAEAAKTDAIAAKERAEEVVDGIEEAGDEQVERVTQTGSAQVQAVTAEGTTQVGNVQTKGQQVLASIPADYTELSENVDELKSAIDDIKDEVYSKTLATASATSTGWRLKENGFCESNSSYKMDKYQVTSGDKVFVESDHLFQFQSSASVPSGGTLNRIGEIYGSGKYMLEVPENATYLIVSTLMSGSSAVVYLVYSNGTLQNNRLSALELKTETTLPENMAFVEQLLTATRNYKKGDQIIISGRSTIALVDINEGETLSENGNFKYTGGGISEETSKKFRSANIVEGIAVGRKINLLDPSACASNRHIVDGEIREHSSSDRWISAYIPVEQDKKYFVYYDNRYLPSGFLRNESMIYKYDNQKQYIGGASRNRFENTVNDGTTYIRFYLFAQRADSTWLAPSDVMISTEPNLTVYMPYDDENNYSVSDLKQSMKSGFSDAVVRGSEYVTESENILDESKLLRYDRPENRTAELVEGYYLDVYGGTVLISNKSMASVEYYDNNHTLISTDSLDWIGNFAQGSEIPNEAHYARVSFRANRDADESSLYVGWNSHVVINILRGDSLAKHNYVPTYTPHEIIRGAYVSRDVFAIKAPAETDEITRMIKAMAVRELNRARGAYRIGTLNIYNNYSGYNFDAIGNMLAENGIDVCGFQESVQMSDSARQRNIPAHLIASHPWQYKYRSERLPDPADGAYSAMQNFVSRFEITDTTVTPYTNEEKRWFTFCKVKLPRYLDCTEGVQYCGFYATHLSLLESNRMAQLEQLAGAINADDCAFHVVCADTNCFTYYEDGTIYPWKDFCQSAGLKIVNPGWSKTVTGDNPAGDSHNESIDQIFVSENINILDYNIINGNDYQWYRPEGTGPFPFSDHDLLYADLQFVYDNLITKESHSDWMDEHSH